MTARQDSAYIRFASALCVWSSVATFLLLLPNYWNIAKDAETSSRTAQAGLVVLCLAILAAIYKGVIFSMPRAREGFRHLIGQSGPALDAWAKEAPVKSTYAAITVLAGTTLFLELVLIRWQASLFPIFALYKNFTLLACFCGLGIGYALARRGPQMLAAALPVLAAALMLLTALRQTAIPGMRWLLFYVPVQEETSVLAFQFSSHGTNWLIANLPIYLLLVVAFVFNVLIMIPVAQYCGCLMARVNSLAGYGCNLLGSIAGVAALFVISWLWMGPVVWFALSVLPVLWYLLPVQEARRTGAAAAIACIVIAAWPVEPLVHIIYSPYQIIQHISKPDGLMKIMSAGTYYQKVFDLAQDNRNRDSAELKKIVGYYELPFRAAPSLANVAIVGAGTGNDVAAALRTGARAVDAVEIDPAIIALGRANHPEHPYQDKRVNVVNDDARTFFRNATGSYDAIVYGVLDSHVVLSHGSNVRVDSFVYTQEGLREAYDRLKEGGLMSVSFYLPNMRTGHKIYRMLGALPGAGHPAALLTGYDAYTYTFMVRKKAEVKLPLSFMSTHDLEDKTQDFLEKVEEKLDLPTDDWPFFYMETKSYPSSYVVSLILVMLLAAFLVRSFLPGQRWDKSMLPFFFLGGGFMLVETKAITELGLSFGNTWHVVGITILGVLVMAFLANLFVSRLSFRSAAASYALLLAAVALGYVVAISGGVPLGGWFAKLCTVVILTCPLLFSGVAFSTLLKDTADVPSALAYNLMGAMLGGLLEYNSMQFGFSFLYVIAFALYALAWATSRSGVSRRKAARA